MPVCIAGMHRSGTSIVTRMLNECGLYLGPESDRLSPRPDNPDGYWENAKFVELNDQVLGELGGAWDCPPFPFERSHDASIDGEFTARVSERSRAKARTLLEEFSDHSGWGWKDPRNSLTIPFWQGLLPDMKVAICLRNPLEVVLSLHQRNRFSFQLGLQLWHAYNQSALAAVPPERRIITHFDAYFHGDPHAELRRVLTFLGMRAADEVIGRSCTLASGDKRHNRFGIAHLFDADVWTEVIRLYLDMCAEAGWLDGSRLESAAAGTARPAVDQFIERLDRRTVWAPLAPESAGSEAQPRSRRLNEEFLRGRFLEGEVASRQRRVEAQETSNQQLQARIEEQGGAIRELQSTMLAMRQDLEAARSASLAHTQQRDAMATAVALRCAVDAIRDDLRRHDVDVQTAIDALRREVASISYQQLVARIRHLVHTTVPAGATVIVVSRGDPELLNLDGPQGWHFPQREDGVYAGFYPSDTADAIAHLETLRNKGGEFLLFPRTALWWLERYEGLKQYLDSRYRMVVSNEDACSIYALNHSADGAHLVDR